MTKNSAKGMLGQAQMACEVFFKRTVCSKNSERNSTSFEVYDSKCNIGIEEVKVAHKS